MATSSRVSGVRAAVCALAVAVLPVAFLATPAVSEPTLTQTLQQVTTNQADEYDPSISGSVVVYTGNRDNNTDVYYVDLADGVEVPVTQAPGSQELSDVSGRRIAYTDLSARDVFVYDIDAGTAVNVTGSPGAYSSNPAIGGDIVVWEDSRDANIELYGMDLATGQERRITTSTATDTVPAVSSDGRVVWQVCADGVCGIALYDWATGQTRFITDSPDADHRRPDLDAGIVVYDSWLNGERDIYAYDLTTDQVRRLALPGSQNNPNISGDVVAFEDVSTGVYHVMMWQLSTGAILQLTDDTNPPAGAPGTVGGEYLNTIDGDRVAFTAQRDSQLDIYVSTFQVHASVYPFTGFFAPVDNDGVLNVVKAGQSVPVKFSLGGDKGLDILAADSPSSQRVTCDSAAPVDLIEITETAGNSGLSYEPVTDQYKYVWKTNRAWEGSCRELSVTLDDGSQHTALFKFR